MTTLVRILFCVSLVGVLLYRYIDLQNQLTLLRLEIPLVAKELRSDLERNQNLRFEVARFESPGHLLVLQQDPRFSRLRFPQANQVWTLRGHFRRELTQLPETPTGVGRLVAEAPLSGG